MNKLILALVLVSFGAPALAQQISPQVLVPAPAPGAPAPSLPPGLHVQVLDGVIQVSNPGGTQNFNAGQFGYVPGPAQPPVIVPPNPGLQFVPPPVFTGGSPAAPATTAAGGQAVDCVVR